MRTIMRPVSRHIAHSEPPLKTARGRRTIAVPPDVLGHADMSMVTTYQHVLPDLQREAAGRMEAFLEDQPYPGGRQSCRQVIAIERAEVSFPVLDPNTNLVVRLEGTEPPSLGPGASRGG
ncbi:MAG: hypothetical protein J2P28_17260 [Actinobacteria bacterium]|nr:hypothetical protein [Actinomycetota bacterium]